MDLHQTVEGVARRVGDDNPLRVAIVSDAASPTADAWGTPQALPLTAGAPVAITAASPTRRRVEIVHHATEPLLLCFDGKVPAPGAAHAVIDGGDGTAWSRGSATGAEAQGVITVLCAVNASISVTEVN